MNNMRGWMLSALLALALTGLFACDKSNSLYDESETDGDSTEGSLEEDKEVSDTDGELDGDVIGEIDLDNSDSSNIIEYTPDGQSLNDFMESEPDYGYLDVGMGGGSGDGNPAISWDGIYTWINIVDAHNTQSEHWGLYNEYPQAIRFGLADSNDPVLRLYFPLTFDIDALAFGRNTALEPHAKSQAISAADLELRFQAEGNAKNGSSTCSNVHIDLDLGALAVLPLTGETFSFTAGDNGGWVIYFDVDALYAVVEQWGEESDCSITEDSDPELLSQIKTALLAGFSVLPDANRDGRATREEYDNTDNRAAAVVSAPEQDCIICDDGSSCTRDACLSYWCQHIKETIGTACDSGGQDDVAYCTAAGLCETLKCIDRDGDRFGENCLSGPDCDDTNPLVNPGKEEVAFNGLDDNCIPDDGPDAVLLNDSHVGGEGSCVTADENYLYYNRGRSLYIRTLEGYESEVIAVIHLKDLIRSIVVRDGWIFAADKSAGLVVIDAHDRTDPGTPVYTSLTDCRAASVALDGDYAYVTCSALGGSVSEEALAIVNIQDPFYPSEVARVATEPLEGRQHAVVVKDGFAYLAAQGNGVGVIDIQDPVSPGQPAYFNESGYAADLTISGQTLLIANGTGNSVTLMDLNTPGSPTYSASVPSLPDYALDVAVMNDTAYVAVANSQIIAAFDISNPASPGEFWPLHCGKSWNHGITATGGYLYVASDYKGLMVINTADTENWKYLDAIARSFNLHVSGGYAYVGSYINQLGIVDISDPANPGQEVRGALSCQCDTEYDVAWDAYVDDGYAFVANDHSGLAVLDVSDPLSPQAPVMFNNGNIAINRVVARDGFAYTTWYDNFDNYDYHDNYNNQNKQKDYYNGDLVVVDARDPLVLTEAARVDLENAMSIALEDNFAYVGEGHEDELNGALSIVDVADPENPVIRSTISLAGASWAIKPVEHTLFIAARSAGLLIVDATDPDNPQQIGQLELGDLANGIEVWGALALIATNMRGLVIVDISDPENPLELGSVNTAGKAQDIQAEGSYLFMTDETNGLEIFKLPSVSLSILR